jgi:hypothetical protein
LKRNSMELSQISRFEMPDFEDLRLVFA